MLQIKNLTVTHTKDLRVLMKDFSFVLNKGDKAAIIGEEGNGKSTLLKIIYDENTAKQYTEFTGDIIKNNCKIGYLPQELTEEEKKKSVWEFCLEESGFSILTPKELADITMPLGMNLEILYADQKMGCLSGGEKVKLQIARLLMGQPDTLLLDEPSHDLDMETLSWLESFMNACEMPILFISHDETLLEHTANVIIHLEQVKRKTEPLHTIARMGYADYIRTRGSQLLHQEQTAKKERSEYEKQQQKFRRIQQKVEYQQNSITRQDPYGGKLLKKKMHTVKAIQRRFEKEFENMTEIPDPEEAIGLKFNDSVSLPNGKTVIDMTKPQLTMGERILARNIKIQITGPEKVCIIGKNGIGKTTLLKEMAAVLLGREDIKTAYMPQTYEDLLDAQKTPVEFLMNTGDRGEKIKIGNYLGSMKFTEDEMNHKIGELSGGQKAKLFLIKMNLEQCNVFLLDEPTRNFSPLSNPVIRSMLKNFKGAVVSVSHDRKYIEEVCDSVYELKESGLFKIR